MGPTAAPPTLLSRVPGASLASESGSRMGPTQPSSEARMGSSGRLHPTLSYAVLASADPSPLGSQLPLTAGPKPALPCPPPYRPATPYSVRPCLYPGS